MSVALPAESAEYRAARDKLLIRERDLRALVEEIAALRRALPAGGVATDYTFTETTSQHPPAKLELDELFAPGKDSLVIYGLMYREGIDPCPMCCAFLDSLDGAAPHITQQINLAVVAKIGPDALSDLAAQRGWRNLRLISSADNSFNRDYLSETEDGNQLPMVNVFRRIDGAIHHHYSSELFFQPNEPGQNPRHVDMLWPLWNVLDLTPEGRGDWYPALTYSQD
jgi:predicted dithiol-disulfide oxidoreductase (DUF899 family)